MADAAIDALVRVVNINASDSYACFYLGQAYEEKHLLKEAKACYKRAFENSPANTSIAKFAKEACARL